jgi:hypothetical protein
MVLFIFTWPLDLNKLADRMVLFIFTFSLDSNKLL